jgi:hypothetical protein
VLHLKCNPATHEHLHAQNDETNGNIEFLQPYHVVTAVVMFEIGTVAISAVLSLVTQTDTSCVSTFFYQSVCCLIWYFLVEISIVKFFTNSNERFRYDVMFENEHTFCVWIHHIHTRPALCNWREQRPSNQGDLDSSVTGEVGRVLHRGGLPSFLIFVPNYVIIWLHFKFYTLYIEVLIWTYSPVTRLGGNSSQ